MSLWDAARDASRRVSLEGVAVVAVFVRGCWRGVVEGVAGGCRCGGACLRMLERCCWRLRFDII